MFTALMIAALIVALLRSQGERRKRIARLPSRDDPRWADSSHKQIAGRSCAECGVKIVTANEGAPCETCDEVAHVEPCLTRHVRSAHRIATNVPYR